MFRILRRAGRNERSPFAASPCPATDALPKASAARLMIQPIRRLPLLSKNCYDNKVVRSRIFYCHKTGSKERGRGVGEYPNVGGGDGFPTPPSAAAAAHPPSD